MMRKANLIIIGAAILAAFAVWVVAQAVLKTVERSGDPAREAPAAASPSAVDGENGYPGINAD